MQIADHNIRFLINMRIIVDEFDELFPNMTFYSGEDTNILEGIRFYYGQKEMESCYVYLVNGNSLAEAVIPENHCSLIVTGEVPPEWIQKKHSIIVLPEDVELPVVFDACQNVFVKNQRWSDQLREIMIRDGSVDDLCRASLDYFKNPLFVHDSQLYVISCPVWRKGMIQWAKDERTGLVITPIETINEFKTDREYLETLKTHGAQIYSASLRGYRDIYVNIWDSYGRYEGRLVLCELDTSLKPGQFAAAEYLAGLVKILMAKRNRLDNTYIHAMDLMLDGMIRGESYPETEIINRIAQYGWHIHDNYVCIRMNTEERDRNLTSIISMCNHIEAEIVGSKAFCDEVKCCIIINLNMNDHFYTDVAYILREGLFKAGISNVFSDFTKLGDYYNQASIALEYCIRKNDTRWSLSFNDVALDYMIDTSCPELDSSYICAYELVKLLEYDRENQTDLYQTLKIYIQNERNTVKTSKELYVGRSTLFYRLRKIKEITGLDTDHLVDPFRNLYLRLSIYLLERDQKKK